MKIVPKICQNFDLKTFGIPRDYLCTCKTHGQNNFLGFKFLFVNRFSNLFVTLLRFLECIRMIHSHFAGDVSVQGDMQKGSSQRMV